MSSDPNDNEARQLDPAQMAGIATHGAWAFYGKRTEAKQRWDVGKGMWVTDLDVASLRSDI